MSTLTLEDGQNVEQAAEQLTQVLRELDEHGSYARGHSEHVDHPGQIVHVQGNSIAFLLPDCLTGKQIGLINVLRERIQALGIEGSLDFSGESIF